VVVVVGVLGGGGAGVSQRRVLTHSVGRQRAHALTAPRLHPLHQPTSVTSQPANPGPREHQARHLEELGE